MKRLAFILLVSAASPAFAEGDAMPMHAHMTGVSSAAPITPSTTEYQAEMMQMHDAMDIDYSGDVDADFARGMVPHHEGAVEMAQTELRYGSDPDLLALAKRIVWSQQGEIGQMRRWLYTRGYIAGTRAEDCCKQVVDPGDSRSRRDDEAAREFMQSMEEMHDAMDVAYTGNADIDFARGMIPHHQGAIAMAYVEQRHGRSPEMQALASGIIRDQNSEIALMEDRLEALESNSSAEN